MRLRPSHLPTLPLPSSPQSLPEAQGLLALVNLSFPRSSLWTCSSVCALGPALDPRAVAPQAPEGWKEQGPDPARAPISHPAMT